MEQGYEDAMLLLGKCQIDPAVPDRCIRNICKKSEKIGAYGLAMCDIYDGAYDSALENIAQGLKESSRGRTGSAL